MNNSDIRNEVTMISSLVRKSGMKAIDIAEVLKISPKTLNDWVKGRSKIPKKRIKEVSEFFNVPEVILQSTIPENTEVKILSGEWISIKDKQPEVHQIVVLYSAGTYYPPTIGFWECEHGYCTVNGDERTCWNVTHWLPLPEMPKL